MDPDIDDGDGRDPEFPSLPRRLLYVFVSPGRLGDELADNPKWLTALVVSAAVISISMALIPIDIFMEAQRLRALERGVEFPEVPQRLVTFMRYAFPGIAALSTLIFSFVFAGLYTLIFAFVLGDEGRFKQYLAVLAHSWFIAALVGLLITPIRISVRDPQFTLNLSSFVFFLPDGYLLNVFKAMDISQIWSTLVFAQGVHAIDNRRSFGSAATICLTVLLGFALLAANWL